MGQRGKKEEGVQNTVFLLNLIFFPHRLVIGEAEKFQALNTFLASICR